MIIIEVSGLGFPFRYFLKGLSFCKSDQERSAQIAGRRAVIILLASFARNGGQPPCGTVAQNGYLLRFGRSVIQGHAVSPLNLSATFHLETPQNASTKKKVLFSRSFSTQKIDTLKLTKEGATLDMWTTSLEFSNASHRIPINPAFHMYLCFQVTYVLNSNMFTGVYQVRSVHQTLL